MKVYELLQQQSLFENRSKRLVREYANIILRIYQDSQDQHTIDGNPYEDHELLKLVKQQPEFQSATMTNLLFGLKHIGRWIRPILRPHPPAPFRDSRVNKFDAWADYQFVREKFYDPIFSPTENEIIDFARNGTGNIEIAVEVGAASQGSIDTTLNMARNKFGIDIPPLITLDQRYKHGLNQKGRILNMLAQGSLKDLDKKAQRIAGQLDISVNNVRSVISMHFKPQLDAAAARLNKTKQQLTAQERAEAMEPELLRIRSHSQR